jgi:uncharacterized membrane protein YeiB
MFGRCGLTKKEWLHVFVSARFFWLDGWMMKKKEGLSLLSFFGHWRKALMHISGNCLCLSFFSPLFGFGLLFLFSPSFPVSPYLRSICYSWPIDTHHPLTPP